MSYVYSALTSVSLMYLHIPTRAGPVFVVTQSIALMGGSVSSGEEKL